MRHNKRRLTRKSRIYRKHSFKSIIKQVWKRRNAKKSWPREIERKQLQLERAQLEQKLEFEKKMEEARKGNMGQAAASPAPVKSAKLPKLVIIKFSGELTDWPRF